MRVEIIFTVKHFNADVLRITPAFTLGVLSYTRRVRYIARNTRRVRRARGASSEPRNAGIQSGGRSDRPLLFELHFSRNDGSNVVASRKPVKLLRLNFVMYFLHSNTEFRGFGT